MMMTVMIRVITVRLFFFATTTKLNDYYVPGTELTTLQIVSHIILITFLHVCIITPIKDEKSPS